MTKLIESLCGKVDGKSTSPKKVQDSIRGLSIQGYLDNQKRTSLNRPQKVLDSADCTKLACSLFSMSRGKRREFMSRVTDSVRRQLFLEGSRIRSLIKDNCIGYDPELCWAIQNAIDSSDDTAEEILEERLRLGRLPKDVKSWFEAYTDNPYSDLTRKLEKALKPFRLTRINRLKDDINVSDYLDKGRAQESKIDTVITEESESAKALSDKSEDILNEVKETVEEKTKSFIDSLVNDITEVIPAVASQNAIDKVSEKTEDILTEDEPSDDSDQNEDVFDTEFQESETVKDSNEGEPVASGDFVLIKNGSYKGKKGTVGVCNNDLGVALVKFDDEEALVPIDLLSKTVKDCAEDTKLKVQISGSTTSVEIGSGVSVFVDNQKFDGVISSMPDGSVEIKGLPKEFYEAASIEQSDVYTMPESDIAVVPVQEPEPAPAEEPESVEEETMTDEVWDSLESRYPEISALTDSMIEDSAVEDAKGFSKEFMELFEKGDSFDVPFKVESVDLDKGTLGLGDWRLKVKMHRDIPKDLRASFSAHIEKLANSKGMKVKVKWPMSVNGSDTFTIVNKGNVADSITVEDSKESDAVSKIVYSWVVKSSSDLATNSETEVRKKMFNDLAERLSVVDDQFTIAENGLGVDYANKSFMQDSASTILVGSISFVYQASESGVDNLAQQVSTTAAELYDSMVEDFMSEDVEEIETEETLVDSLDALKLGYPLTAVKVQDDGDEFIIRMSDIFGRDVRYVTETGDTTEKAEAKRFSNSREAFKFMSNLSKEGKLKHSIYNSSPVPVMDDSLLSDEAKNDILSKVEEQIVERLKEKGVDVSDVVSDSVNFEGLSVGDVLEMTDGTPAKVISKKSSVAVLEKEDGSHVVVPMPGKVKDDSLEDINKAIEEAESETETDLTPEQKESGDYKKGHVTIQGFDIAIENPKGSVRSGVDADGNEWSQEMHNTYGYFEGTKSKDKDDVDVFIGPNPLSESVFIVDQLNSAGEFDEHKVMFGFDSSEEARAAYLSNYEDGWTGLGDITKVSVDDFRKWVTNSEVRNKPFTEYLKVTDSMDPNQDGDDRVFVNWAPEQLMEYYAKLKNRKITKSDYPAFQLQDDAEFGEDQYQQYEEAITKELEARGLNPTDEVAKLPVPRADVKTGIDNTYDIPHNCTTYHNLRNTESALTKVLEIASKVMGRENPITVDEYKDMLDGGDPKTLLIIADSAFTLGELDLICPELYKRKFTDSFWVVDSTDNLESAFNVEIPEQFKGRPAIVATNLIDPKFVKDSVLEFPYDDKHSLYVAPYK